MVIREALVADIEQMQVIRNAVKENRLSNPNIIQSKEYEEMILQKGKGWVCEINKIIVGFAFVDLQQHNIWALFVDPEFERRGVGKALHDTMLNWYFVQTREVVWLSTAAGTRAEVFYRKAGWKEVGLYGKGEIKFEMNYKNWSIKKAE